MLANSLLVSSIIFSLILFYNTIMTIICCSKMDKANTYELYLKHDMLSDEYGNKVKPAMYCTMVLLTLYFLVKWVF